LKISVFQQAPRFRKLAGVGDRASHSAFGGGRRIHLTLCGRTSSDPHNSIGKTAKVQNDGVLAVNRGSWAIRKRACVPWRADVTEPPGRSWSSYENETRASLSGDAGWVGKCA
jgi:hypothetical protein